MKDCDCGARLQAHERDCASLEVKEIGVLTTDGLGKTLIILMMTFCILLGVTIGTGISIHQISEAPVFETMAEGMSCESLIDTYQEDPKAYYGLPTDESSWWYVGIAGNDAMGNEINNRCLVDGQVMEFFSDTVSTSSLGSVESQGFNGCFSFGCGNQTSTSSLESQGLKFLIPESP